MLTVAELNSFIVGNKSRNCLLKVKARKDRNCYGKVKNKMVWHRMFENIHRILKGLLLGELCAASLHSFVCKNAIIPLYKPRDAFILHL